MFRELAIHVTVSSVSTQSFCGSDIEYIIPASSLFYWAKQAREQFKMQAWKQLAIKCILFYQRVTKFASSLIHGIQYLLHFLYSLFSGFMLCKLSPSTDLLFGLSRWHRLLCVHVPLTGEDCITGTLWYNRGHSFLPHARDSISNAFKLLCNFSDLA